MLKCLLNFVLYEHVITRVHIVGQRYKRFIKVVDPVLWYFSVAGNPVQNFLKREFWDRTMLLADINLVKGSLPVGRQTIVAAADCIKFSSIRHFFDTSILRTVHMVLERPKIHINAIPSLLKTFPQYGEENLS